MSLIRPALSSGTALSHAIGRKAVRALHAELVLYPKPGLVSPVDSGAHADMDARTFLRSLFALRHYFVRIAAAGQAGAPFPQLQALGIAAERRMLAATGGVNTHRGAIFSVGLLAAAAGWRLGRGLAVDGAGLAATIVELWGDALAAAQSSATANGARAVRRYGVRGARDEALDGFPSLVDIALPALAQARDAGVIPARMQALFAVMAHLDDTNLLHRGGRAGLEFVRGQARLFLARGGVFAADWHVFAQALHQECVARNLSPGGAADMLAAACFVESLTS